MIKRDNDDKYFLNVKEKQKYTVRRVTSGVCAGIMMFCELPKMAIPAVATDSKSSTSYSDSYEEKNLGNTLLSTIFSDEEINVIVDNLPVSKPKDTVSLEDLKEITYLTINHSNLNSLEMVKYMPDLSGIFVISSNIDDYSALKFSNKITEAFFGDCNISDSDLQYFTCNLITLDLSRCNFISDLSNLSNQFPNLEYLYLNCCSGITDSSFIYEMKNLKLVDGKETMFVTSELLNYLKNKNIETNISKKDLDNIKKVDQILASIINEDMDENDIIREISLYVIRNMSYDYNLAHDSNDEPLTCALEGNGVCASYAYLSNILFTRSGITSYEITTNDHVWNLIEEDDKYYYIDTTNMDNILGEILASNFGIGKYYMKNPYDNSFTIMENYNSGKIIIPKQLVEEIKKVENTDLVKEITSRYGIINEKSVASILKISALIIALEILKKKTEKRKHRIKKD